ncbi:hypothetical protein SAMN06309944_0258 [Micrococcales bacterium KH10]|nr:hypothetical protein SAMN06309944_0258 [Micrococcales bacterium KH10]
MEQTEFVEVAVTCTTADCENHNITIPIQAAIGGMVVCGPCGTVLIEKVDPHAD